MLNVTCTDYKQGAIDFADINADAKYDADQAYKQSKLAGVLFTEELSQRLADSRVNVFSVRPPLCRTALDRHLSYYNSWFGFVPDAFFWLTQYSTAQGAESIVHACLDPKLDEKCESGKLLHNCADEQLQLPADHRLQARKLWMISEKWTRLAQ